MNIFILGASGLVGGNCLNYFRTFSHLNVVGSHFSYATQQTVPFNTLNLNDSNNFDLDAFQPNVLVHCGALTWVDYCEQNPEESYQKTVESTKNAIELAKKHKAKLVYISTDYVFDGTEGPYAEDHAVNPISIYGKHKLEAEQLVVNELGTNSLVLRITNVYGDEERNKNFVARLIDTINKHEPTELKLPSDQYATPVNAADIARAMYLLLIDDRSGIYNIASTDFVNRVQLANLVIKHFPQHQVKVVPVTTAEFNPPAPRPLLGGLVTKKFMDLYPTFHFTNVDDYVRKKVGDIL